MPKKAKKPTWGWEFTMIVGNIKDDTKPPPEEDTDYIYDKFVKAVERKGLTCGGGAHPIRLDIILCSNCFKAEALDDCDYCLACLDKIAQRHGYKPQPPLIA